MIFWLLMIAIWLLIGVHDECLIYPFIQNRNHNNNIIVIFWLYNISCTYNMVIMQYLN